MNSVEYLDVLVWVFPLRPVAAVRDTVELGAGEVSAVLGVVISAQAGVAEAQVDNAIGHQAGDLSRAERVL
jgi:hypothetical protein